MCLVDTNVWLERLLDQERTDAVGHFLDRVNSEKLFITDFAFHSISLLMSKLNRADALLSFIQDAFLDGAVDLVRLEPGDIRQVVRLMEQ